MKKILVLFAFMAYLPFAHAQFNVTYISDLSYNQSLNDIWGYVDPNGVEYALVGAAGGTSIVSLEDPANPVEVAYVPGANSIWRDIKTWGTYAYVTTDQGQDGLTVIDLSDLPNSVSSFQMTDFGALGTLTSCHNIWIDEFGFAYLSGCNLNGGGIIYVDCATDPANPQHVGQGFPTYSHDVYTRDNKMYTSEIYAGEFGIYDVTDKLNTQFLGSQETDYSFTHNTWLNDAGDVLFTTDEQSNAPVGSYDVSDPSDIKTLDLFKPLITLNDGVIPHNVHVWNDWIIVSYYTDGCIIIDGSNPSNLIEVGNFDTYIPSNTGFNGAWGAYPFLPSGLVLISDIGNGLYILEPNYVRACWLEGVVTDAATGNPINGAEIAILTSELNQSSSDAFGEYKTGLATAGTYDVTYSAPGYNSKTISVTLDNGVLTIEDVELEPFGTYAVSGTVLDALTAAPIPGASVVLYNDDFTFEMNTDDNGNFSLASVFEGDYTVIAGHWGHLAQAQAIQVNAPASITLTLERGYRDEFAVDLGWTVSGNAATGHWERGEPFGTTSGNGTPYNPEEDISSDLGNQCFVTGNDNNPDVGNDDVDNGNTVLTSPAMDLSDYSNVVLSFYAWFANGGGNGNPDDEFSVRLLNGTETMELTTIDQITNGWDGPMTFNIPDDFLSDNMTIEFETADLNAGHLVEAAVDLFEVTGEITSATTQQLNAADFSLHAYPNPFQKQIQMDYELPEGTANARLVIYNAQGQQVYTTALTDRKGTLRLEGLSSQGLYMARIEGEGLQTETVKILKIE